MKNNKKQWVKYISVVLSFMIMAGFCFVDAKVQVNATEEETKTEEGGNDEEVTLEEPVMTVSDSWNITVKYINGSEENTETIVATVGSGATIELTELNKTNWTFEGWLYNGEYYGKNTEKGNMIFIPYNETGNITEITVRAQWRANSVTIIYNANEKEFAKYTVEHNDIENPNVSIKLIEETPTMDGSTFNGWLYNGKSVTADTVFTWEEFAGKTIELQADWKTDNWSITVNYVSDGSKESVEESGKLSDEGVMEIPVSKSLKKENWTFEGWLYNETSYLEGDVISIPYDETVKEITLEAQWRANPVTIKYLTNGEVLYEYSVEHENINDSNISIKLIEDTPTNQGYIFNGWLYNGKTVTVDTVFSWEEFAGKTIEFQADWIEEKQVSVHFKNGDMDAMDPQMITVGDIKDGIFVIGPGILDAEDMIFNGWICDAPSELIKSIEGNIYTFLWDKCKNNQIITFTAQWWDGDTIENGKTYFLTPENDYTLGAGSWTVSKEGESDDYTYNGTDDAIMFCVTNEGNYTFTNN